MAELSVGLKVDPGKYRGSGVWPMGVGVPFPKGRLSPGALKRLAIVGAKQGRVPASIECRCRWDDGSVRWIWADFQGIVSDKYELRMRTPGKAPVPKERASVKKGMKGIEVSTGKLAVSFAYDRATPVKVVVGGNEPIPGDGKGAYLVDHKGRRAVVAGSAAKIKWTLETDNPERVVLRVEGLYVESGKPVAALDMRYDFRAGQPWFTIEHRLVVVQDMRKLPLREYGVTFPGDMKGGVARFGMDGRAHDLKVGEGQAWVFQKDYPRWSIDRTECQISGGSQVTSGKVADGWACGSGSSGGVVVAVRDFPQQFPNELLVTPSGVTAKLWSSRGGILLDYRATTCSKHFWGYIRPRHTRDPELTESDMKAYDTKPKYSPVGSARTHYLFCGYYTGRSSARRAQAWNNAFQRPPVVLADPAWSLSTGIFPKMAVKNARKFPKEEEYISGAFDGLVRNVERTMNGWYSYGDLGFEPYIRRFRLSYTDCYNRVKHIWLLWIRSGDRKYLDFGERLNRIVADFRVGHWGDAKGKFGSHAHQLPVYWGGYGLGGSSSSDVFHAMWMAAFLRDDRYSRQLMQEFTDGIREKDLAWTENWARNSPIADMKMMQVLSAWQLTQDPDLLKRVRVIARGLADPACRYGISATYQRRGYGPVPAHYKYSRTIASLCEYDQVCGPDPEVEKALDKAFVDLAGPEPVEGYDGRYGGEKKNRLQDVMETAHIYQPQIAVILAYAYARTGDVKCLHDARRALDNAMKRYCKDGKVSRVNGATQGFALYAAPQLLAILGPSKEAGSRAPKPKD